MYWVPVSSVVTSQFQANAFQAFTAEGKVLEATALAKLLRNEIPVLVSADGNPVDPLHLRLLKKGSVILVLPQSKDKPPSPFAPSFSDLPKITGELSGPAKENGSSILDLVITGPETRDMNLEGKYIFMITNKGTRTATKTQVVVFVPKQLQILKVSEPGVIAENVVAWNFHGLPRLPPGSSKLAELTLKATEKGKCCLSGMALADPNLLKTVKFHTTFSSASPQIRINGGKPHPTSVWLIPTPAFSSFVAIGPVLTTDLVLQFRLSAEDCSSRCR